MAPTRNTNPNQNPSPHSGQLQAIVERVWERLGWPADPDEDKKFLETLNLGPAQTPGPEPAGEAVSEAFQPGHNARRRHLVFEMDTRTFLAAVNQVFFQDFGFRGNTADYYNPDNSFIDRVLETRQGIPISLATVYSAVCRLAGRSGRGKGVQSINMPQHFMLSTKLDPDKEQSMADGTYEVFIDVFNNGALSCREECWVMLERNHVPDAREEERYLAPVTQKRLVWARCMRNLVNIYHQSRAPSQDESLVAALSFLIMLDVNMEQNIQIRMERARHALALGYLDIVASDLRFVDESGFYGTPLQRSEMGQHIAA